MEKSLVSLPELKLDSKIWYKIHIHLYDLWHFEQSSDSRCRLESVIDPSYLGEPYFAQDEAEKIKDPCLDGDKPLSALIEATLHERLERRIKKRVESGDYRVCAAHDVALILEKAFGMEAERPGKGSSFSGHDIDTWSRFGAWSAMDRNQQAEEASPPQKWQEQRERMTRSSLNFQAFKNHYSNRFVDYSWDRQQQIERQRTNPIPYGPPTKPSQSAPSRHWQYPTN